MMGIHIQNMLQRLIALPIFYGLIAPSVAIASLEEVLVEAYQVSPQIQSAYGNLEAQRELKPQAFAAFLPEISARGVEGVTRLRLDEQQDALDPTLPGGAFSQNLSERSIEANARLNVFAGGSDWANLRVADAQIGAQYAELLIIEQMVLGQVALAYGNIYYFDRQAETISDQIDQLQTLAKQREDMLARQNATTTDVAQISNQLAQAQAQYDAIIAQRQAAVSQLIAVLGYFDRTIEEAPQLPGLPETREQAFNLVDAYNPSILQAEYQLSTNEHTVGVQRGALFPRLDVVSFARRDFNKTNFNNSNDLTTNRREDNLRVALEVTVPIFSGGALTSQVRQAKKSTQAARFDLDDIKLQVISAIDSYWAQLESARLQSAANQRAIDSAEIALAGLERQFQEGTLSTQDLLLGQQLRYEAALNFYNSELSAFQAHVNLLVTMGQLGPSYREQLETQF